MVSASLFIGQPLGDSNVSLGEKPGLVIRGSVRTREDSRGTQISHCVPALLFTRCVTWGVTDLSEAWFSSLDNGVNNSYCEGSLRRFSETVRQLIHLTQCLA